MNPVRRIIEEGYPFVHKAYSKVRTPNQMKEDFIALTQYLGEHPQILDFFLEEENSSYYDDEITIANAAGMNKDGLIPSKVLAKWFDANVIGTVLGDPNEGNSGQTIWLNPTRNNEGLPSLGSEIVKKNVGNDEHVIPVEFNIMQHPKKEDQLGDIEKCLDNLLSLSSNVPVKRYTLNISCPNTGENRDNFIAGSSSKLELMRDRIPDEIELGVKVSPDSFYPHEIKTELEATAEYIDFIVGTNTTKFFQDAYGIGGISGRDLTLLAYIKNKNLNDILKTEYKDKNIRQEAVGGINSREIINAYKKLGITNFRVYNHFIERWGKGMRELRRDF